MGTIDRRSFLKNILAGGVGAGVAWQFGGSLALGQLPVDQKENMPRIDEIEGIELDMGRQLGDGIKNEAPRIVFDKSGKLHAMWVSEREDGEQIYLVTFDGTDWSEEQRVSDSKGFVDHPAILALPGGGVAMAWTEFQSNGKWDVCCREFKDGKLTSGLIRLDEPGIAWRPALATGDAKGYWLITEEKSDGAFGIYGRQISHGKAGDKRLLSPDDAQDCMRPSAVTDKEGMTWVVWDQAEGANGPHVYLSPIHAGEARDYFRVSNHPASNIAADIDVDEDNRLWIAWHSNQKGNELWDIPRWYYLRAFSNGKFYEPVREPAGKDLTKAGTDQSFEFPRVTAVPGGGVLVSGRPSHNFCFQLYQGYTFSPLYRVPQDGWGGRGQYLATAFDSDGNLWVARRDLNANVVQKITGIPKQKDSLDLREFLPRPTAPAIINIQSKPNWEPLEELEGINESLNFYYGDIHGHTWMSDGMGDVDEYFHVRRDYYGDDFASLTDHDTFVGNGILPSEFEFMKEITKHYNEDERFVTLYGQEYTTARHPKGIGHKCIYSLDQGIPLFDHTDEGADTSDKLNALCREHKALLVPHHVAWTGTDWENADDSIQRLAEIVSNHGAFEYMGNEPIPHRGGKVGHFIQDGLARGLKFGIIGGADNHGLIWHHGMAFRRDSYRTGLAVVLAPELTAEAIFDAMWKRRVYGTSGIKPRMDFRVNNHLMGEEISAPDGKVLINVDVSSNEDRLKWLTIVKDNKDWYRYGGEGWRSFFTIEDEGPGSGEHYYYLRVEFQNGDMAWSSPIWVTVA